MQALRNELLNLLHFHFCGTQMASDVCGTVFSKTPSGHLKQIQVD
jgi:hypothetical protein